MPSFPGPVTLHGYSLVWSGDFGSHWSCSKVVKSESHSLRLRFRDCPINPSFPAPVVRRHSRGLDRPPATSSSSHLQRSILISIAYNVSLIVNPEPSMRHYPIILMILSLSIPKLVSLLFLRVRRVKCVTALLTVMFKGCLALFEASSSRWDEKLVLCNFFSRLNEESVLHQCCWNVAYMNPMETIKLHRLVHSNLGLLAEFMTFLRRFYEWIASTKF